MLIHQVYAMVDGEGLVQNVCIFENYEDANRITRAVYGDAAYAVDCLQYGCQPGDKYHDGYFWRVQEDGTEKQIERTPTEKESISTLEAENEELTLLLSETIGGVL